MELHDYDDAQNGIWAERSQIDGLREIIKKFFRVTEISLFLFSLTWASVSLPLAVNVSGNIFRRIQNVVAGHLFIFLLGNAIFITLFLKSRCEQGLQNPVGTNDFFLPEFIDCDGEIPLPAPEEIVYKEKLSIATKVRIRPRRRSKKHGEKKGWEERGRRSETAVIRREKVVVDELSNEEFRRAIEEFIGKQIKFRQQEKDDVDILIH